MQSWIMVDLETSGLIPGHHEITEAAFVDQDGVALAFRLSFDESKAHPQAMKVQGYGQRDYARLLPHHEALQYVTDLFDPPPLDSHEFDMSETDGSKDWKPPYIVGWPAQFDVSFLNSWFHRHGVESPWHYRHVIDVRSFATALYGFHCDLTDEAVKERWNIDRDEFLPEHSALADAKFQAAVFKALTVEANLVVYE